MTLLYLYLEKYGILEQVEFNFSDKYRFHFNPETQELTYKEYDSPTLPADFFSINKSARVVDCISAIIGNNGSGKTSVARAISDILNSDFRPNFEYIIIFDKQSVTGASYRDMKHRTLRASIPTIEFNKLCEDYNPPTREFTIDFIKKCYSASSQGNSNLDRANDYFEALIANADTTSFEQHIELPVSSQSTGEPVSLANCLPILCSPAFVYNTNHYTPFYKSHFNSEPSCDLSTSYLMQNAREAFAEYVDTKSQVASNKNSKLKYRSTFGAETVPNITDYGSYDIVELLQMVHFFSQYQHAQATNSRLSDLKLPKPRYLLIAVLPLKTKRAREFLCEFSKSHRWKTYASHMIDFLEFAAAHSIHTALRIFFSFTIDWLANASSEVNQRRAKLMRFVIYCIRHIDFIQGITFKQSDESKIQQFLEPTARNNTLFADLFEQILVKIPDSSSERKHIEAVLTPDSLFKEALSLYDLLIPKGTVWTFSLGYEFVNLNKNDDVTFITDFLTQYFRTCSGIGYMSFRWHPELSAGEYAQYAIFSRLYKYLDKALSNNDNESTTIRCASYILFFDEIEITIHPELQRCLIENVIRFLEEFFGLRTNVKVTFHLIFASHSPILVSDIPRSNVVFLKRDPNVIPPKTTTLSEDEIASKATFGANIHTLYKDSFFLEHGLIGSFALDMITRVVKELKSGSCSTDLMNVIKIIDEPMIRSSLEDDYFANIRKTQPDIEERMLLDRLTEIRRNRGGNKHE